MKISPACVSLIQQCEGCFLSAYKDGGGVLTIGFGHTRGVHEGQVITGKEASDFLAADIEETVKNVNNLIKITIPQACFDAVIAFAYNIGSGNFGSSTLLKLLNEGRLWECPAEFLRWYFDNKKPVKGLLRRRLAEAALFVSGL